MQIGLDPKIEVADIDERVLGNETALDYALRLAIAKGRVIVERMGDDPAVIAADTVVMIDNQVLGKPRDALEAKAFLRLLSGREHAVATALALFSQQKLIAEIETTRVFFDPLTDEMINAYIETRDCFDKAGGYGIQSFAGLFIPRIDGCFFNVMGFPLNRFLRMADQVGLPLFPNGENA
jgi:septum formation protein